MNKILKIFNPSLVQNTSETLDSEEVNSTEINIAQVENQLQNWSIPKQEIKTIYKIGTFEKIHDYAIKQTENTISLNNEHKSIHLLSEKAIHQHKNQNYKFIHIGLVQVAIKPLFRLGIDTPVCMILRDARHQDFNNSLLALAQSNLANGPIFFNCYPNFSLSLNDANVLDSLVLTIKTQNMNFIENTKSVAVIYRVYYKVMATTLNPKAKIVSKRDETMVFEANNLHATTFTPKRLKWNELTQNSIWNFEDISQPKPIEAEDTSTSIIEQTDGSVQIVFNTHQKREPIIINRPSSSGQSSNSNVLRRSTTLPRITPQSFIPERLSTDNRDIRNVDFDHNIPQVVYQDNKNKQPEISEVNYSPTRSQMEAFGHVMMITNEFIIDKLYLKSDYYNEINKDKREWYINNFREIIRIKLREQWYQYMNQLQINIPFFIWLSSICKDKGINYPFQEIDMNTYVTKTWKTLNNQNIISVHPPLETIAFNHENTSVIATPFKSIINDTNDNQPSTKLDIKNIHCQNNYSNQILSTIASQLDRIENSHPSKDSPSFFPREGGVPSKPLFQPFEFPTSTKITLNPQKQLLE